MATVNYYINTDTGNDTTGDGSSGAPWATLANAITDSGVRANTGNDIIINCTGGTKDTSPLLANISSAILCNTLTIQGDGADANQFDAAKYTLSITQADGVSIRSIDADFTLKDFQIEIISTSTLNLSGIATSSTAAGRTQTITNVRILFNSTATGGTQRGLLIAASNCNTTVNNLIIDFIGAGTASTEGVDRISGTLGIYNSLVNNADNGYDGIMTAKNCIAANTTDAYDIANVTATTCAGDQAGDTGVTQVTDWTAEFTNVTTKDFTLKSTSPILKDGGTDVSSENGGISTDIDGSARGGTWDIGPSEEATPALSITGPDTCTAEAATQLTGTELDTATSVGLRSDDLTYTKASTIDAQTTTTLDFDALTGWAEATVSTDVAGVPLEPTVTSVGITAYQLQAYVSDGATTVARNIQVDAPSGYNVVQTMISDANTTAGEGVFDPAIIAVEDDMQAVLPTSVSGVTLNVNSKGEITVPDSGAGSASPGQVLNFPIQYFSPITGDWSEVDHSWTAPGTASSSDGDIREIVQGMVEDLVENIFHLIGE